LSRHHPRRTGTLATVALLAAGLAFATAWPPPGAQAQAAATGAVQGLVVDAAGFPVAGASITSADLGRSASTSASGRFAWSGIPAPATGLPVTIEVRASGFGTWTIRDVPIYPNDTLLLEIQLGSDPVDIRVPPPRSETPTEVQTEAPFRIAGAGDDQMEAPIPSTIRVRVTGYAYCDTSRPYTVQVVDFKEYVKHVLPNEWISSWPRESLRAGAMAAKMYAWRLIADGGKWPDADVYDSTCDQVYLPSVSYASTNRAVDFTWNWRLTKDGMLVLASYRATYSQCLAAGKAGRCIGQWDTYYHALGNNGYDKLTWDEMLLRYYEGSVLSPVWNPPGGFSLRYYGNGWGDIDRVKIPLDAPARPADVGAGDFTIEWWMKAAAADNPSTSVSCGAPDGWITGNVLIDRDVYGAGDYGDYGVSIASGRLAFGVAAGSSGTTACGTRSVADGAWHHVAVTRRAADGRLQIYLDGALDGQAVGPTGDLSYRDGRITTYPNDPYLVLGGEKHDAGPAYPSYNGLIDELRISNSVRYDGAFAVPSGPFSPDANTVALVHFDEGVGNTIHDSSGAAGGPSSGVRNYGGLTNGPEWTDDSPWYVPQPTPTPHVTPTPSSTPTAATGTPAATATPTRTPSATTTPAATATNTAPPSATASNTATPTRTSSPTPLPASATPVGTPTPVDPSGLASSLTFQTVVTGLSQPVFVGHAGDGSGRLFVLERAGRIRVITASGTLLATPFLDIASLVGDGGSEQGLLGLAFHPSYESNGRFYVAYTDNAGSVVLARYLASSDPSRADPSSAQVLLTIPKPFANHNGGMVAFGPDGYLYLAVGDGGGAGDPDNNAQNRTVLLGKILRLDVDGASPYAIPADNPFVADPDPAVRREIWAYGLRNPWRFSFDRARGDLFIGDVGQGSREEIDYEAASYPGGGNYGWRVMEGSLCYNPASGCDASGKILPVAEYDTHAGGSCAVTGGYVYRGVASPALRGVYLFGDYCSGRIWGSAQQVPGAWITALIADTVYSISSFGQDEAGEMYLVDYAAGAVVRIAGPGATPTSTASPAPTMTPSPTPTPPPADVNEDGRVDVLDVQLSVNVILGTESRPSIVARADTNGDGRVDVLDTQRVINVILAG